MTRRGLEGMAVVLRSVGAAAVAFASTRSRSTMVIALRAWALAAALGRHGFSSFLDDGSSAQAAGSVMGACAVDPAASLRVPAG